MKYIQVRVEDHEYAQIADRTKTSGFPSIQAATRKVLVEWASGETPRNTLTVADGKLVERLKELMRVNDSVILPAIRFLLTRYRPRKA